MDQFPNHPRERRGRRSAWPLTQSQWRGRAAAAALLLLGTVVAYRMWHRINEDMVPDSDTSATATIDNSSSRPVQITKPLNIASLDADRDTWPTEILSDGIERQFADLGTLLSSRGPISNEALRRLVDSDVVATVVSPESISTVYQDGGFRVQRVADAGDSHSTTTWRGADQLAAGLRAMLPVQSDREIIHTKFKIVHIQRQDKTATGTVRVQFDGQSPDRRWQQNSQWECVWITNSALPLLAQVQGLPEAFERVEYVEANPAFTDQTSNVLGAHSCYQGQLRPGINYWLSRLEHAHGIDLIAAHGVSVADVDGDGNDDVYLCQPGGLPNRLFLSAGDGQTIDRSADLGLDICDRTRSALFVDLDNDADQDLALVVADEVIIFENSYPSPFAIRQRIRIPRNPTTVIAADYDNDGLLDLYVLNHDSASPREHGILGTPIPFHDANNGGANVLLRNLGDLQFEDVTVAVGLQANNQRFSLAGCWEDFDDDGDMDVYVANDFGRNNLYRNDAGKFVDVAGELDVEDVSAGMSVSWGDVDNDRHQDLYIGNMFSSAGNRIAYQRRFHEDEPVETRTLFQRLARGNTLFRQNDDGTFQDVSQSWNVTMGRWAWASKLADVNNDGWLDVLIANGFVTNEDTNDL